MVVHLREPGAMQMPCVHQSVDFNVNFAQIDEWYAYVAFYLLLSSYLSLVLQISLCHLPI